MPFYNDLRPAYGLARRSLVHGDHRRVDRPAPARGCDRSTTASILDFVDLRDDDGNRIALGARRKRRRRRHPPLDARGAAEGDLRRRRQGRRVRRAWSPSAHVSGTELGELQLAIWRKQFAALRDGDRFFYLNDLPVLNAIRDQLGIDFRRTLAQVIRDNVPGAQVADDVFEAEE